MFAWGWSLFESSFKNFKRCFKLFYLFKSKSIPLQSYLGLFQEQCSTASQSTATALPSSFLVNNKDSLLCWVAWRECVHIVAWMRSCIRPNSSLHRISLELLSNPIQIYQNLQSTRGDSTCFQLNLWHTLSCFVLSVSYVDRAGQCR